MARSLPRAATSGSSDYAAVIDDALATLQRDGVIRQRRMRSMPSGFKTVLGKDLSGCVIADQAGHRRARRLRRRGTGAQSALRRRHPPVRPIAAQGPLGRAVRDGVLSMDQRGIRHLRRAGRAGATSASAAMASTAPATSSSPSAPPSCAAARMSRASPAASIWMARSPSRARPCAWSPAISAAPVPSPASATAWPSAPAWASRPRAACRKTTASATSTPVPFPTPCARSASPSMRPNASSPRSPGC